MAARYRWRMTDDPSRMQNGMLQINTAVQKPPKQFAQ
jgi:hypothetical protein